MARETQGSPVSEKKLEQYGVWVKVKPREVPPAALEESFELSDLDASKTAVATAEPGESALTVEEEKLLDELETELAPEAAENVAVPEEEPLLAESELPDIESSARAEIPEIALGQASDEELPELEEEQETVPRGRTALDESEIEVTLSEDIGEKDRFNDLEALETELATVASKPRDSSAGSSQILARIEEELRSIRTDLTQLRSELSGLRQASAEAATEEAAAESPAPGGFFDEDEDETIALTGDELDNILNTAEITEESGETPAVESVEEQPAAATEEEMGKPPTDILSYETPVLEEDKIEPEEAVLEMPEATTGTDEELVLDEEILPSAELPAEELALSTEELPAELELEELVEPEASPTMSATELPEIDLEGIPEIESEAEPTAAAAAVEEEGSETIDLDTLDLGEEPTVVDAVPEQVEDLEALTELGEPSEAPAEPEEAETADELSEGVDLEALAAEAAELEGTDVVPALAAEDMEIGDLETIADTEVSESAPAETASKDEIEISFEAEGEPEDLTELVEPVAEEAAPAAQAAGKKPAPGATAAGEIPDNMKDEIRTVLKYMDHLLEALPDEKIQEFASSEYFVMYKKLFEDLGLGE